MKPEQPPWQDAPTWTGWYWFVSQDGDFDLWEVRRPVGVHQARRAGTQEWRPVEELRGRWQGPFQRRAHRGKQQDEE